MHLRDHRLRQVPDAGPVAGDLTLELAFAGREPVGGRAGVGRVAAEVVAGGEALARAADDRHAHVGVGVGFAQREDDLAAQRRVERVALLRPVQRDAPHHRRGVVHQDHGVGHGRLQLSPAVQHMDATGGRELLPQRIGVGGGERNVGELAAGAPPDRIVDLPPLPDQVALEDLVGLGHRQRLDDPHERRRPLRAEVVLLGEERDERVGVELDVGAELDRRHHPVAELGVGHAVHRGQHHRLPAQQDALDRRRGEVLAVDPDPVGGATGEVEEAVVVAVARGRRSSTRRRGSARASPLRSSSSPRSPARRSSRSRPSPPRR